MEIPLHTTILDEQRFTVFAIKAYDKVRSNNIRNMFSRYKVEAAGMLIEWYLHDKRCTSIVQRIGITTDETNALDYLVCNSHGYRSTLCYSSASSCTGCLAAARIFSAIACGTRS